MVRQKGITMNVEIFSYEKVYQKDVEVFRRYVRGKRIKDFDEFCYIETEDRIFHCYVNHRYSYVLIRSVVHKLYRF